MSKYYRNQIGLMGAALGAGKGAIYEPYNNKKLSKAERVKAILAGTAVGGTIGALSGKQIDNLATLPTRNKSVVQKLDDLYYGEDGKGVFSFAVDELYRF